MGGEKERNTPDYYIMPQYSGDQQERYNLLRLRAWVDWETKITFRAFLSSARELCLQLYIFLGDEAKLLSGNFLSSIDEFYKHHTP